MKRHKRNIRKDTKKVFKDFINSKSKEIESKKDKVEVNGKIKVVKNLL